ncbi:MAG: GumC family protein, partial [Bryobacteraceae bacterium]
MVYAPDRETLAQEKLRGLQTELARAQAERVSKQSAFEMISTKSSDSLPILLDNGELREYDAKLDDLRRQMVELSAILTPKHYKIRQLQSQIEHLERALAKARANMIERIRSEYVAAQHREELLATAYQDQMGLVAEQAGKGVQYNMLKREVDSTRKIYEIMLQRVEELSLASAMRASTIRVVDNAIRPTAPYTPNWLANSLGGLIAGLSVGMMLAVIRSRSERTLRDPGETPAYLDIRELGVIPSGKKSAIRWLLAIGGHKPKQATGLIDAIPGQTAFSYDAARLELESWFRRRSSLSESFSAVVNSILLSRNDEQRPKTILITSPELGDGKTTVCTNLAIALAKINSRVLLIDGDTRRPNLHSTFGLANESGLIELLKSEAPLDQLLMDRPAKATCVPGLFLLPAGNPRDFEPALLHSHR